MTDKRSEFPVKAIRTAERDGYRLQWVDDGTDYPALWAAFRRGELTAQPLGLGQCREVYRVETEGRRLVFKRDTSVENRWEKRLLVWLLGGTRYTRILRLTCDAVARGCRAAQRAYLVAERMDGRQCPEAYLIAEYVEGRHLRPEEIPGRLAEIGRALAEIHRYGLASNDCHPNNFLLTDDGMRMIDLDMSSWVAVCQVNDILAAENWGVKPSPPGAGRRILKGLLRLRLYLINVSRRLKGKRLREH